jgi:hypothetical protein
VESAGLSLPAARPTVARAARAAAGAAPAVLIVAVAAALRLAHLGSVPDNPFYDAAVRSMSLSLHNFFFGAFDPSARLAVDKPPLDLWLQVASVKLFGFTPFAPWRSSTGWSSARSGGSPGWRRRRRWRCCRSPS